MTDTETFGWDEFDADETLTTADQKAADSFGMERQPGLFLCEITDCVAIEKEFRIYKGTDYTSYECYAASLSFVIKKVLEINQPVLDEDGKPLERDGVAVGIVKPVPENMKEEIEALYGGIAMTDDISLYHPKEKPSIKNRRVFVARRIGLIGEDTTEFPSKIWPQSIGKLVLVRTEWNIWQDKNTKETKRNARIAFSGYDYASNAGIELENNALPDDDEFGDI